MRFSMDPLFAEERLVTNSENLGFCLGDPFRSSRGGLRNPAVCNLS